MRTDDVNIYIQFVFQLSPFVRISFNCKNEAKKEKIATMVNLSVLSYHIRSDFILNFLSFVSSTEGLYKAECRPFVVDGQQVGVIRPNILMELLKFPEVFLIREQNMKKFVELNPAFRDYNERSEQVDRVLRQLRKDEVFITLKGWRDEVGFFLIYFFFGSSSV